VSAEVALDSTAIAAIFFKDPNAESVSSAVRRFSRYHTLDLAFAEVGNVAWKRIVLFKEDRATSSQALKAASDFIANSCSVTESRELLSQALDLGSKYEIPLYDALFLTLASKSGMGLLTTDEILHRKVSRFAELKNLTVVPSSGGTHGK
jgi:predicted nucleic acid-binding protein